MATKNEHTGAELVSKAATKAYQEGWDRIFGKKKDSVRCDGDGCQGCGSCMANAGEATPEYVNQDRSSKDNCQKCGKSWDLHEWGVPAPYCP